MIKHLVRAIYVAGFVGGVVAVYSPVCADKPLAKQRIEQPRICYIAWGQLYSIQVPSMKVKRVLGFGLTNWVVDAVYSPDHRWLAVHVENGRIYIVRPDGSCLTRVRVPPNIEEPLTVLWPPDSAKLWVWDGDSHVWTIDIGSPTSRRQSLDFSGENFLRSSLAFGDKGVVYIRQVSELTRTGQMMGQIWCVPNDGSAKKLIVGARDCTDFRWSQSKNLLAYTRAVKGIPLVGNLYIRNADLSKTTQVYLGRDRIAADFRWSHKGARLCVSSYTGAKGPDRLHIIDVGTGKSKVYRVTGADVGVWSSDDRFFAYQHPRNELQFDLRVLDLKTSKVLLTGIQIHDLVW